MSQSINYTQNAPNFIFDPNDIIDDLADTGSRLYSISQLLDSQVDGIGVIDVAFESVAVTASLLDDEPNEIGTFAGATLSLGGDLVALRAAAGIAAIGSIPAAGPSAAAVGLASLFVFLPASYYVDSLSDNFGSFFNSLFIDGNEIIFTDPDTGDQITIDQSGPVSISKNGNGSSPDIQVRQLPDILTLIIDTPNENSPELSLNQILTINTANDQTIIQYIDNDGNSFSKILNSALEFDQQFTQDELSIILDLLQLYADRFGFKATVAAQLINDVQAGSTGTAVEQSDNSAGGSQFVIGGTVVNYYSANTNDYMTVFNGDGSFESVNLPDGVAIDFYNGEVIDQSNGSSVEYRIKTFNDYVFGGDGNVTYELLVTTDGNFLFLPDAKNNSADGLGFFLARIGEGFSLHYEATNQIDEFPDGAPGFLGAGESILEASISSLAIDDSSSGTNLLVATDASNGAIPIGQFLFGATGNDLIIAGRGADTIRGGQGNDLISAGPDGDSILGGEGSDTIYGNSGSDTIDYNQELGSIIGGIISDNGVELRSIVTHDEGIDYIYGIEVLIGTGQNDLFYGGVFLGDGNDLPIGSGYRYEAGAGIDTLDLSAFEFVPHVGTSDPGLFVILQPEDGEVGGPDGSVSWITGDQIALSGFEVLVGTERGDVLAGSPDDNSITGGMGDDTIYGLSGSDTLYGDEVIAAIDQNGNDLIYGEAGDDVVFGGYGGDTIDGGDNNDQIFGEAGADSLLGGLGSDILDGGEGSDTLTSTTGDDSLYGGDDNDTLIAEGVGTKRLSGGAGNDLLIANNFVSSDLYGEADDDLIQINLGTAVAYGGAGNDRIEKNSSGSASIFGNKGNDEIIVLSGSALINAGSGDDDVRVSGLSSQIFGEQGNDVLRGGSGNDLIDGGQDNDIIRGGSGNDELIGDNGNDVLFGEAGTNFIDGGADNDILYGGADASRLYGSTGEDQLFGQSSGDSLFGGSENDILSGTSNTYFDGGDGADLVNGSSVADTTYGGDQNDRIFGNGGADTVYGGDGNDVVYGGDGADLIYGGDGDDTLWGDVSNTNITGAGDTIYAGDGNDLVYANVKNDSIFGEAGDDRLYGGQQNDIIYGGEGNDQILGNRNNDILYGEYGDDVIYGDIVPENSGQGDDTLYGGSGHDKLFGNEQDDALFAGDGDDELDGGSGDDFLVGASGDDLLEGGAGDDFLGAGSGQDVVRGDSDDDTLVSTSNGDLLDGGSGNDLLIGGSGTILEGGSGVDNFISNNSIVRAELGDGIVMGSGSVFVGNTRLYSISIDDDGNFTVNGLSANVQSGRLLVGSGNSLVIEDFESFVFAE